MAKTKPIGVRFREDILESLKNDKLADTPQGALVFLETFYLDHKDKIIAFNALRLSSAANSKADTKASKEQDKPVNELKMNENPTLEASLINNRIQELEKEIKSPPKNPQIGLKVWLRIRENEISSLKQKLKSATE